LILLTASVIYGTVAGWRRRWYARDPGRRRGLRQPVISVGNLSVGGSGKTPIVAHLARMLTEYGERPAVLSRGYGRRLIRDGVTVVSDGVAVLGDVDSAGDEPLMLARMLPGVPVVVSASRYLAGRLAEDKLGANVHLLDDGFQHVELKRDIDLLVTSEEDLTDRPMPRGRLRESLAAAAVADASLVATADEGVAARVGRSLGVTTVFRIVRALGVPRSIATGETVVVPAGEPVFAVAGIARPERFFTALTLAGWKIAGTMAFRDHHVFTDRDVDRAAAAARSAAASIVMTTEKDAVRLAGCDCGGLNIVAVPLAVTVEPEAAFVDWLRTRLQAARLKNLEP
jgi:tetraacyldisaccharide 4'-kinase